MRKLAELPQQRKRGLRKEIADLIFDPDRWLRTPHELLGGREPLELLESGEQQDEQRLIDLLESIKHGLFS